MHPSSDGEDHGLIVEMMATEGTTNEDKLLS
jgi:hypothetical protein